MKFYVVFQGNGRVPYLRAANDGLYHHENIFNVKIGDKVFISKSKKIVAYGYVKTENKYDGTKKKKNKIVKCYRADLKEIVELEYPVALENYKEKLEYFRKKSVGHFPYNIHGQGNQIYLCEISEEFASFISSLINESNEITNEENNQFLDELEEISSKLDSFNEIMESKNMYKSDISEKNYKELVNYDFEIQKKVEEFSSIKSLDVMRAILIRQEQGFLRKNLFKNNKENKCCICGKKYPVSFMVAAHIKKRSLCTKEERLDVKNIVAPMCKFGCDEMFERGYVVVENGNININYNGGESKDFIKYLKELEGRKCLNYNKENKQYYDYHKEYFEKAKL